MTHATFLRNIVETIQKDPSITGLAIGGSRLTKETDEFSDLDLVLVTAERIAGDKEKMRAYAASFGHLLSAFTGDHVGEPRLLICLYDDPLLHVDIKFLTPAEFHQRVEDPEILHDPAAQLKTIITETEARFPYPSYQWIEDRFWTWVHYATLKLGRGELLEAFDFFAFIRHVVLGPLLLIKNGHQPRGVRRVETKLPQEDLGKLLATIPACEKKSIAAALQHTIDLYRELRTVLYTPDIKLHTAAEHRVVAYFNEVRLRRL